MFPFLEKQNTRPPLFSAYTAEELWTESHVARQMLAYHLDPDQDIASRNHRFIERSVGWLSQTFDLASGKQVLDLGCGPGLYANGLAALGARVTAVDFSEHSLAHARSVAQRGGLDVEFLKADYLDLEVPGPFDLVLLIYGDLCALSPSQRQTVLTLAKRCLAPAGRLVFDVFSAALFNDLQEEARYESAPNGGFWSSEPYFLFSTRFKYEEEKVYLDRHAIIEADRQRELFNWIQCYEPVRLSRELDQSGWEVEETLGTLAGDPFDPSRHDFGVVARPSS